MPHIIANLRQLQNGGEKAENLLRELIRWERFLLIMFQLDLDLQYSQQQIYITVLPIFKVSVIIREIIRQRLEHL